jgi:hypothetical protein
LEEVTMNAITIIPDSPDADPTSYRAVAGEVQAVGKTAGEALDAISARLGKSRSRALLILERPRPDHFFTAAQQQRLQELMTRWRAARDAGNSLPAEQQAELDALVAAEVQAAGAWARAVADGLTP